MRQVRETTKTLKILTELIKQFEAEKTALMVTVAETAGEYAL